MLTRAIPSAAVIAVALAWTANLFTPPPLAAAVTSQEFSTQRALEHVATLAAAPRPLGARQHAIAANYIANTIERYGLSPERQDATVFAPFGGVNIIARVQNIVTRLSGSGNEHRSILLVAHYDTVDHSPGAADNSAAVAALLETMRALVAGPRPRHDVMFLFTDAEELGMLGARGFLDCERWKKDVALVLNFDARGSSGASVMFATGPGTERYIAQFAASPTHPIASAFSADLYQLLPNYTDMSIFAASGLPGLDFAFIDGVTSYHSSLDTIQQLDPRSLQHHGLYALELARGLRLDVPPTRWKMSYFPLPVVGLVTYPERLHAPLAIAALLAFALLVRSAAAHGLVSVSRLALCGGLLCLIVAAGTAIAAFPVFGWLAAGYDFTLLTQPLAYGAALFVCCAAVMVVMLLALRRRYGDINLIAGASGLWLAIALIATIFLPLSAYLFVFPALSGMASFAVLGGWPARCGPRLESLLLILLAAPILFLWTPVLYMLPIVFNIFIGELLGLVTGLVLVAIMPQLLLVVHAFVPPLTVRSAILAACATTALLFGAGNYFQPSPRGDSLLNVHDLDSRNARWVSFDRAPDAWTRQYLTDTPRHGTVADFLPGNAPALVADAPFLDLPAPTLVRSDAPLSEEAGAGRSLHLTAKPADGAASFFLTINASTPITKLAVDGQPIPVSGRSWQGMFYAAPPQGFSIAIALSGPGPVRLTMADQNLQLPQVPGRIFAARDGSLMPKPFTVTDLTLVKKSFSF